MEESEICEIAKLWWEVASYVSMVKVNASDNSV
jgi:hypothetical protein